MRLGFLSQRWPLLCRQRPAAAGLAARSAWVCAAWLAALTAAPAQTAAPAPWPLAAIQADSSALPESRYLYVGKGETWQRPRFSAQYQASAEVFAAVRLDDQLLFSQALTDQGTLEFELPALSEGFHRLDFAFTHRAAPSGGPADYCAADIEDTVLLHQAQISYEAERAHGYRLQQLPDALANPHRPHTTALQGEVHLQPRTAASLTAAARLASSWTTAANVQWRTAAQPPADAADAADFTLVLEQVPELPDVASIALEASATPSPVGTAEAGSENAAPSPAALAPTTATTRPLLRIRYRNAEGLEQAVHALLNANYLAQLNTAQAAINEYVTAPRWAGLRAFATLADLGLQDIRLDGGNRALQLVFPGIWQSTDILQGQLVLQAQQGLLPGSALRIWIDNALAGSIAFSQSPSGHNSRSVSFQSPRANGQSSFDVRLETALVTNGNCLPRTRGALWIDAAQSQVTLPHHIKSGVASLSAALVPQPSIRVDDSPAALDLAIGLLQTHAAMLLDGRPVPARIVTDIANEHTVTVNVDADLYRQRIAAHSDAVYAPYAQHGTLVLQDERQFRVIAETPQSVGHFLQHWPTAQAALPDGAREVLLAQDGDVIVLARDIPSTKATPAMQPSTITTLGALVMGLLVLAIAGWLWRARRKAQQA